MRPITLEHGKLTGMASPRDSRVNVWRGIPYAQPPVGSCRWQPPAPLQPWTGIREATTFGASSYQPTQFSSFVWSRGEFEVSEDCLYLNVWARKKADQLPVMVWFHGGAHTSGQGSSAIFDGTMLANHGVVVVSINYRLGVFGFLAHPWLSDESGRDSAGNYGLLDKIAALQWVRKNIASFGGDPDNVTIFGQSAGSQSVCSLMASPVAAGLFHKAIGQSATCVGPESNKDIDGRERGAQLVSSLGASNLEALRALPTDTVHNASITSGWVNRSKIVIDGYVLIEPQIETYRKGLQAQVPLMLGSLSDEGVMLFPKDDSLSDHQLTTYLEKTFGEHGHHLKTLYARKTNNPGDVQHAIATDFFMAFGMRRWAQYSASAGNATFLYFMDHVPPAFHLYMPESPMLDLEGGPRSAGAYHSGDLAFVFGTVDHVGLHWTDKDTALSSLMVNYWTNFARNGNPNADDWPPWQGYTEDGRETMCLNSTPGIRAGVRSEALDMMAAAYPL